VNDAIFVVAKNFVIDANVNDLSADTTVSPYLTFRLTHVRRNVVLAFVVR